MAEYNILDCGDNSCNFALTKKGMRTNGGCRCLRDLRGAEFKILRIRIEHTVNLLKNRILDLEKGNRN